MQPRLLSFFSDIERSLEADQPSSPEGSWQNSRTVNYFQGLARLDLGMRPSGGKIEQKGSILLQGYQLADESPCLKAALTWSGVQGTVTRSIFSNPDMSWTSEARKIAAEWLGGAPSNLDQPSIAELSPAPAEPVGAEVSA
jgi:hypothetical protein